MHVTFTPNIGNTAKVQQNLGGIPVTPETTTDLPYYIVRAQDSDGDYYYFIADDVFGSCGEYVVAFASVTNDKAIAEEWTEGECFSIFDDYLHSPEVISM